MGLAFAPRGGSGQVARGLAHALEHVTLATVDDGVQGGFEGAYASMDDAAFEREVERCAPALARADVFHLHHLTPLNEAAHRIAPDVPVIGHLHGTELLMLEAIEEEPDRWPYGRVWAERMREWAARAHTLIVPTRTNADRAEALLGIDRLTVIPNGYDAEHFVPDPLPHTDPALLYVGRFTAVKRVPLLIEAYEQARPGFNTRAPLVLVGGYPGETEGEHPSDTIARIAAQDVHLAGWHAHEELPALLNRADVIILPSVREQFGQSLVEGMACGLPGIAVDAYGPADIVRHGETGWLVEPDDVQGLANALVEAVNRPSERQRRGLNAAADVRERFAWSSIAQEVADLYDATILRTDAAHTA